MDVSILITAYREATILPNNVRRLLEEMEKQHRSFEIIVCDDGSGDDTVRVVAALEDPRVRCVTGEHLGKGGSLARGVAAALGDLIFYTDADLAYGTAVIPVFLSVLEEGEAALVIGSRPLHKEGYEGYPLGRRLLSSGYRFLLRLLGGISVTDSQCGCKAYTAAAAKRLFANLSEVGFSFELETLLRARKWGLAVREYPVRVLTNGTSHVRPLRDGFSMLCAACRIKRRYS